MPVLSIHALVNAFRKDDARSITTQSRHWSYSVIRRGRWSKRGAGQFALAASRSVRFSNLPKTLAECLGETGKMIGEMSQDFSVGHLYVHEGACIGICA